MTVRASTSRWEIAWCGSGGCGTMWPLRRGGCSERCGAGRRTVKGDLCQVRCQFLKVDVFRPAPLQGLIKHLGHTTSHCITLHQIHPPHHRSHLHLHMAVTLSQQITRVAQVWATALTVSQSTAGEVKHCHLKPFGHTCNKALLHASAYLCQHRQYGAQVSAFRDEVQGDKVQHDGLIVPVDKVRNGFDHAILDVVIHLPVTPQQVGITLPVIPCDSST
jgi:hypothetical protein